MSDNDIKELTQHVEDAVTYPILTKEVDGGGAGDMTVTATGALGGGSINRLARDTIRSVLGWRYRENDVKGFTAALTRSFTSRELQGRTEWEHKPQYLSVQADMGEVTGAQASIHARAKVALDQILPLLDSLKPLRPDVDEEDVEAMRSIIRTELGELVQELGIVGGPRVARVDSMFALLLGNHADAQYRVPGGVKGQLGDLRDRLGLQRERVNTIEEEQTFTNYVIIVDYVNSLHQTWTSQRSSFVRNSAEPSLGTELVLLSQLLEVIVESVHETCVAMDSVGLGAAERRTTELDLGGGRNGQGEPITIAELLDWTESFAANEARQLIEDAGKDGIVALRHTLLNLFRLVTKAWRVSTVPSTNPVRGFHTARVQAALGELREHVRAAAHRANKLERGTLPPPTGFSKDLGRSPRPSIAKIESDCGTLDSTQPITITGADFDEGATVEIEGLKVRNVDTTDDQTIHAVVGIPRDAELGKHSVYVETHAGRSSAGAFFVSPPLPPPDTKTEKLIAKIADDFREVRTQIRMGVGSHATLQKRLSRATTTMNSLHRQIARQMQAQTKAMNDVSGAIRKASRVQGVGKAKAAAGTARKRQTATQANTKSGRRGK